MFIHCNSQFQTFLSAGLLGQKLLMMAHFINLERVPQLYDATSLLASYMTTYRLYFDCLCKFCLMQWSIKQKLNYETGRERQFLPKKFQRTILFSLKIRVKCQYAQILVANVVKIPLNNNIVNKQALHLKSGQLVIRLCIKGLAIRTLHTNKLADP